MFSAWFMGEKPVSFIWDLSFHGSSLPGPDLSGSRVSQPHYEVGLHHWVGIKII